MNTPNSSYTVLARRYRPQSFSDVIGQNHVATALRNAIKAGRVAHAYLFTGARGVGKTSMARILAKALNCPHAVDGIPCNQCDICQGITSGQDVDILEIDGASNRGIDDIRSLRANVGVKSMRTKYKIYIIDEVHMLTKEAFNALLKTLEEPPPNVKFVFCTTEPHKVPDTILSRCQRFDFSSIDTSNIVHSLTEISEKEGIAVTPEAIELVARRAGGSMRDSQSLFDQLLAFGSENVTAEDVNRLLGTAGDDRLIAMTTALLHKQVAVALMSLSEALASGVQVSNLTDQMIACFRDLMVFAAGADNSALMSVSETSREMMLQLAKKVGLNTIVAGLQILSDAKTKMSRVVSPRPLLELAFVRISMLEDLSRLKLVLEQLHSAPSNPVVIQNLITENSAGAAINIATSAHRTSVKIPEAGSKSDSSTSTMVKIGHPSAGTVPTNSAYKQDESPAQPDHDQATQRDSVGHVTPTHNEILLWDVWTDLIAKIDERTRAAWEHVDNVAISGPNALELYFPVRYNFSRNVLDKKPEMLQYVEQLWMEMTGVRRKVALKSHQGLAEPNKNTSGGSATGSQQPGRFNSDKNSGTSQQGFNQQGSNYQGSYQQGSYRSESEPVADKGPIENDEFMKKVMHVFQANILNIEKMLPEN
jgi:DNA polymerase-3 subunit gamma/tau